jgi:hypothetical protein
MRHDRSSAGEDAMPLQGRAVPGDQVRTRASSVPLCAGGTVGARSMHDRCTIDARPRLAPPLVHRPCEREDPLAEDPDKKNTD